MRVLMVSDVYFPRINGVSTAIQTCRETLAREGIDLHLVAPDYGGESGGEAWISRVRGRPVPRDPEDRVLDWKELRRTVDAALARGCDLVHVQTPFLAHYAAHAAARRHRLPVIATYHTLFEEYLQHYAPFVPAPWLRGMARRFSRRQCNALDAVVVPSQAIRRRLGEYGVTTPMHVLRSAGRDCARRTGQGPGQDTRRLSRRTRHRQRAAGRALRRPRRRREEHRLPARGRPAGAPIDPRAALRHRR